MKKLLTTTALIGLIGSSVSSFAETKVTGQIEQTVNSRSYSTTSNGGDNGMGQETNLKISSSKDLDNGMGLSGHFQIEDGAVDSTSIKLSSGAITFEIGTDTGTNIHSNINPRVGDQASDATGVASDSLIRTEAHDSQHASLSFGSDMGSVTARYAPGTNTTTANDNSATSAGGSITEFVFKGNLGVEGLSLIAGVETATADTNAQITEGTAEEEEKVLGISYGQGAWRIGATRRTLDDGTTSAEENSIDTLTAYSATYAISDSLSIGYERTETEFELSSSVVKDEESDAFTVGYNLGGLGVTLMYVESENAGAAGAAGTAGTDIEGYQIRTVYSF